MLPSMNLNQVTLPATDVAASTAFYRRLGFEPVVLAAHYARFRSPEGPATLSIHQAPASAPGGAVVYLECEALDETVARLEALGVVFEHPPRDEPWLWREARLSDPAGNRLCLYHAGTARLDPPWRAKADDGPDPHS